MYFANQEKITPYWRDGFLVSLLAIIDFGVVGFIKAIIAILNFDWFLVG